MAVPEEPPSPVMPTIVLLILGLMLTVPSMMTYDPNVYWTSTIAELQTHILVGAFLIPICLGLAVQAFGIPRMNPIESSTPPPLMETISQNLTISIILVSFIFFLLMVNPLRNVLQDSWTPPPTHHIRKNWW